MECGQSRLGGGSAIGFTSNRFSRLPIVTCSIVGDFNHVDEAEPIVLYVINIYKDSFSYTNRRCHNGQYTPWTNDKLIWIAIADE